MSDKAVQILHVDDDDANRYAVSRTLINAGFSVSEAGTGREAISRAASNPDLVILDIRLPDISGFEVCKRLKADPHTSHIPVLHLSATASRSEDKVRGLEGGADAYLVRPVDPLVLIATVRVLLRNREMEESLRKSEEQYRVIAREADNARAAAEQANRLKDEFLAMLSHELRTPLNAIIGWSEILRSGSLADGELEEGLETIERNAKAQSQLIDDLLDVSRIISGKLRLDVHSVDLVSIINEVVASTGPSAMAKKIQVQKQLPAGSTCTWGDSTRLQQIVWNLVSNSVKFTGPGGTITVSLKTVEGQLELSVKDTGRGIATSFLPHVFERFRQADSSSRRSHGGLGLGLAIVRQLVELHGGTVEARSPGEGMGAEFIVRLPIHHSRDGFSLESTWPVTPAAKSAPAQMQDLTGLKVLIVEDEPDSRQVFDRLLTGCGASVTAAASVSAAIAEVDKSHFDVIVSDIGMPEQDGYDFIRQVRSKPAAHGGETPAIALTAFARAEDRAKAELAGYQAHIAKPADPAELTSTVARIVRLSKTKPLENPTAAVT